MTVLGIESSCDECAVAVVRDGKTILSSVINSQVTAHQPYDGVVPELASRLHVEAITPVYRQALAEAGLSSAQLDAIAVTNRPGLVGSLLVGVSFAKALAFSLDKPLLGVDHILAHLYAPNLEQPVEYPHLGLLVSGGHTLLTLVRAFDEVDVLGTTIDDAVGEAFDKVAKYYGLGYPGGKAIDDLAKSGDSGAYKFPHSRLDKGNHPWDVSYSGLKTAVINQKERFLQPGKTASLENLCASFQKAAVDVLWNKLEALVKETGVTRVVAGGGVAANSYLRSRAAAHPRWTVRFPSLALCSDNAAMIAGWAWAALLRGDRSTNQLNAESRVARFKRKYP
ncbi:MAG: tRNA (adenosine(37)-N6)-threonylcarbamoyltransferase complex transferase subunit TsaD [Spirochaetales bacterium]